MAMTPPDTSPHEPFTLSQMSPQPPRRRRTGLIVAAVVGVLVVVAATAAATVALTSGRTEKPTVRTLTPTSFQVIGVIRLQRGGFIWGEAGDADLRCHGWQGFDDIQSGAQVIVRDSAGTTVATGSLDQGKAENIVDSGQGFKHATTCALSFTVNGVPAGKKFYSVEVSHRGQQQYNEDRMHSPISLSLG
jgi:hypothetical protein